MSEEGVLRSVFDKFDSDKTGTLSVQQFTRLVTRLSKHVPELKNTEFKELRAAFSLFDTNSDGKIEYEEFKNWWYHDKKYELFVGEKAKLLERAYQLFISFSIDNKMTEDEFEKMMISLKLTYTREDYIKLTSSSDGVLDFQKFCNWLEWF